MKTKFIYFSPTKTSETIAKNIALGIKDPSEFIDITLPNARKQSVQCDKDELLFVVTPVYMGRIPVLASGWLKTIKATNTPTVCVVVYGNRAYDDALLELKNILTKCECNIIAGAAFIGEHSFSSNEYPSSAGRPNAKDLSIAQNFGNKIQNLITCQANKNPCFPGIFPYRGATDLWHVDFIDTNVECSQCGICASNCPVGAINHNDCSIIDKNKCILCCACIKRCPINAKSMKAGLVKEAAIRVHEKFNTAKEPEFFF